MFCSASVTQHLLRGLAAALLLYSAFHFAEVYPFWIIPALIGAFILMRGCPTCWLFGLVETIAKRRAGDKDASVDPKLISSS